MRLSQLVEQWGPPVGGADLDLEQPLGPVTTDSRSLQPGSLFVPLVGERFDGHRFLAQALERGALAAVVERSQLPDVPEGLPAWPVDDTQAAYQLLGTLRRQELAAAVVAVTGSAGKTTTRELLRAALAPLGPVLASVGNENNDVGVPLTLLKATGDEAAVVVEMGMRGPGEIERLSRCARPDIAVITNIGTAHIGRLGSREAIATAKCEIVTGLPAAALVVVPAGDPLLEAALSAVWPGRVRRLALAGDGPFDPALPPADGIGQLEPDGTHLSLGGRRYRLPLPGAHNARNLLLALTVALELGVPPEALADLRVELPGGRSARLKVGGVHVLDETYNASPEATEAALRLLAQQGGRRFAVLGTMFELGEQSLELHAAIGALAARLGLDGLVVVDGGAEGQAMLLAAAGVPLLERVADPAAAAGPLGQWLRPGDTLLLKASRGVALERLIPLLREMLPASFP
ncbi:UDP-N-acetylmuramoyl-tripeptide--D-alanyl-D-alanine ligase [Cyanobium sp. ATX 6F1]|uniref:UDP-N-acetylmuramoyl-tripeptide--D-alanyl-D- alanine ligase n=1 Tax=Cyanobium sp. ATX 6F1 TaxID=2823702 RepID=UPI0020CC69B1|nr:UDP-N-acetylmuramoyl-tripeptide--D-alanyl-D-alanine ligase [Cyanobium sp. ATX 6F1]MCP9916222.1 UDP-N-acetylmuramoyl-tripeptide--D-alanyl-D-alanine ligase [Cyanobium sp. ATX 6F1]